MRTVQFGDLKMMVNEEFIEERGLVFLYDGTGTRLDVSNGVESVVDITLASKAIANTCKWEVLRGSTICSDHYPIVIHTDMEMINESISREGRWKMKEADWEMFQEISENGMLSIKNDQVVEDLCRIVSKTIIYAASEAIPKSKPGMRSKIAPWWTLECKEAIKSRNRAFRILKKTHNFPNLVEYKRSQSIVRRIVRKSKKEYWIKFCNSIGRSTPIERVWGMIRRMRGCGRSYGYPVMQDGDSIVTSSKRKAELIAKVLVKVHSSDNLSQVEKEGRADTVARYSNVLLDEGEGSSEEGGVLDKLFSVTELNNALRKLGKSTPDRDSICSGMLENLGERGKEVLVKLFNKVWQEGIIPSCWKESVVIPIKKPGMDPTLPDSYRPIALTSQMGKVMERMVNDRLVYYFETKGMINVYQSGFRRGKSTMDPMVCLEHDIRKAQVAKETVLAVFFDIVKAYDTVWKQGLLIKLKQLGIRGRVYCWVKDFLSERKIAVRIHGALSTQYEVENGIPQGSIISPLLFSIAINAFSKVWIGLLR